ncbi:MAG: S8 family serine peptidase [Oscillospiraceae bacterium]|jgi:subtilisin family serine protease|nr:S8 family serine peptidase [Oscillospiraceae bacterium]
MQEVIVKYSGDLAALGYPTEILSESYAVLTVPEGDLPGLTGRVEIEYAERPKRLTLSGYMDQACVTPVRSERGYNLSGAGVLVAVIDSGIDYRHDDFRNADGSTRILALWDQTQNGSPPPGFLYGSEYIRERLDEALASPDPLAVVPQQDFVGHGTAVAGIAAGNGRASGGAETGVAPDASLIAVKLGERDNEKFARTTEIMRALKYVYDRARAWNMPLAVNLSYGTNDGSHDGKTLFEGFVNDMADRWKSVIAVPSGNEGNAGHHFRATLRQGETADAAFTVGASLPELALCLWKNSADTFSIGVTAPNGVTTGTLRYNNIPSVIHLDGANLRIEYRQPNHYNQDTAVYLFLEPESGRTDIPQGVWTLRVGGDTVVDGTFDVWLPTLEAVSDKTAFLVPSPGLTLTLPSCADKVITVGGYDAGTGAFAPFSGRGYTRDLRVKPDIVAPAVNVRSCRAGGGYGQYTGTSMAAPYVAGSAALIMEWGILKSNDPYLYGQRIKAFLRKGAERSRAMTYPDSRWGYGTLCLSASMNLLRDYAEGD